MSVRTNYQKSAYAANQPHKVKATGWYCREDDKVWGMFEHRGDPWSVDPTNLIPADREAVFDLKIEIDDTGNGKTSWMFSFRRFEVGPDSVWMTADTFWDKVSMSRSDLGGHTYMGRNVTGITIHLEQVVVPPPPFHPGGPL